MPTVHQPVLLDETLALLTLTSGDHVLDATIGGGGHAEAILTAIEPEGVLLGIDRDANAVQQTHERLKRFGDHVTIVHGTFSALETILADHPGAAPFNAILLDVGLSSDQLEDAQRGFSFQHSDAPLDMRMNQSGATAADLLNTLSLHKLTDILSEYGGEQFAGPIAAEIVSQRQKQTLTFVNHLTAAVLRVYRQRKPAALHQRRNVATKTFQALRIAVNDELAELASVLPAAAGALAPGGRIACITFHSLEHRIVKNYFRRESTDCLCPPKTPICVCGHAATLHLVARKAVVPTLKEQKRNPRSRSAELRVAERLP